jgi:hypothetical protein
MPDPDRGFVAVKAEPIPYSTPLRSSTEIGSDQVLQSHFMI